MILSIHSDASYLSAHDAKSQVGGHFFLGWMPQDDQPIKNNGAIHVIATILKFVAASALSTIPIISFVAIAAIDC